MEKETSIIFLREGSLAVLKQKTPAYESAYFLRILQARRNDASMQKINQNEMPEQKLSSDYRNKIFVCFPDKASLLFFFW